MQNIQQEQSLIQKVLEQANAALQQVHFPPFELQESSNRKSAKIYFNGQEYSLLCKKTCSALEVNSLLKNPVKSGTVFFTSYISPASAELMVKNGCPFADTAGNLYLKYAGSVIFIQNRKKPKELELHNTRGRAWTSAGLKVLFLLLTEQEALNWNYRKTAEYSGVSLGSVRYIIADLKNKHIIIDDNGKYRWCDRKKAISEWSCRFKDKLLPNLERKLYQGTVPPSGNATLAVSGETAAQNMSLLRTSHFLAYQQGNINTCILKNRWEKDSKGNIEIRQPFWPEIRKFSGTVPPLLIYADLLAEEDPRCQEAALEIYRRYLEDESWTTAKN